MTLPPAGVPLNVHIHYRAPALNGLHRESCSNHPDRSVGAAGRPRGDSGRSCGRSVCVRGGVGGGVDTNCMLEEEDQIMKRMRE